MKVGMIGLPFSGKTTIFNALTGQQAEVGVYGSRKENIGQIKVPDERIDFLSSVYNPKRTIFTEITFEDMCVMTKGAKPSEGFSPQLLSNMRQADAITIIIRSFLDENIPTDTGIDPMRDLEEIELELRFADLAVIEKRLEKSKKNKVERDEENLLIKCKEALESEKILSTLSFTEQEHRFLSPYKFLTQKPMVVLSNSGDSQSTTADQSKVETYCSSKGYAFISLNGKIEMELSQLSQEEKSEFLKELGIERPITDRFIRKAYELLNLISFFTAGDDEVRAWTIHKGDNAQKSAGKIHSDLEKGFIRAEVVAYNDFKDAGSWAKTKDIGKFRLEGKEYTVQDGDIMVFRFNI